MQMGLKVVGEHRRLVNLMSRFVRASALAKPQSGWQAKRCQPATLSPMHRIGKHIFIYILNTNRKNYGNFKNQRIIEILWNKNGI